MHPNNQCNQTTHKQPWTTYRAPLCPPLIGKSIQRELGERARSVRQEALRAKPHRSHYKHLGRVVCSSSETSAFSAFSCGRLSSDPKLPCGQKQNFHISVLSALYLERPEEQNADSRLTGLIFRGIRCNRPVQHFWELALRGTSLHIYVARSGQEWWNVVSGV